jgi:putative membrane protein
MNEETGNQTSEKGSDKPVSPASAEPRGGDTGKRTGIVKLIAGLASKLGLGHGGAGKHEVATGDVSTNLAYERTDLAMDRNMLAAERTLMAWIRTSLSMISFGFTIGKLGQVLHDVEIKGIIGRVHTMSVENIAYFLVILGTGALIGASLQHWKRIRELRAMGLRRQPSMTLIVALLLSGVGGFTLTALILSL